MFRSASAADDTYGTRQKGHLGSRIDVLSFMWLAWLQPLQINTQQHDDNEDLFTSSDSGRKQMGQSPKWLLSGCLNNNSSRSSAIRSLHSFLCCFL
mmetsp:Transcript_2830/g.4337  ORF Transcript_2830/g.4337 Transcript_2830/m.4337 type:complete len:96 (-) Transcript_2830:240-527(-)